MVKIGRKEEQEIERKGRPREKQGRPEKRKRLEVKG